MENSLTQSRSSQPDNVTPNSGDQPEQQENVLDKEFKEYLDDKYGIIKWIGNLSEEEKTKFFEDHSSKDPEADESSETLANLLFTTKLHKLIQMQNDNNQFYPNVKVLLDCFSEFEEFNSPEFKVFDKLEKLGVDEKIQDNIKNYEDNEIAPKQFFSSNNIGIAEKRFGNVLGAASIEYNSAKKHLEKFENLINRFEKKAETLEEEITEISRILSVAKKYDDIIEKIKVLKVKIEEGKISDENTAQKEYTEIIKDTNFGYNPEEEGNILNNSQFFNVVINTINKEKKEVAFEEEIKNPKLRDFDLRFWKNNNVQKELIASLDRKNRQLTGINGNCIVCNAEGKLERKSSVDLLYETLKKIQNEKNSRKKEELIKESKHLRALSHRGMLHSNGILWELNKTFEMDSGGVKFEDYRDKNGKEKQDYLEIKKALARIKDLQNKNKHLKAKAKIQNKIDIKNELNKVKHLRSADHRGMLNVNGIIWELEKTLDRRAGKVNGQIKLCELSRKIKEDYSILQKTKKMLNITQKKLFDDDFITRTRDVIKTPNMRTLLTTSVKYNSEVSDDKINDMGNSNSTEQIITQRMQEGSQCFTRNNIGHQEMPVNEADHKINDVESLSDFHDFNNGMDSVKNMLVSMSPENGQKETGSHIAKLASQRNNSAPNLTLTNK